MNLKRSPHAPDGRSKPGERRGGRRRGTPNKTTVAKAAALEAASANPNITPLEFLLGILRDQQAPIDLRIRVAQIAAPLVHEKPGKASSAAAGVNQTMVQSEAAINLTQARTLRDIERRLSALTRKRYAPSEYGGPLTESEHREEFVAVCGIGPSQHYSDQRLCPRARSRLSWSNDNAASNVAGNAA